MLEPLKFDDNQERRKGPHMNKLSKEKRAQILGCLVEGNSLRATARI